MALKWVERLLSIVVDVHTSLLSSAIPEDLSLRLRQSDPHQKSAQTRECPPSYPMRDAYTVTVGSSQTYSSPLAAGKISGSSQSPIFIKTHSILSLSRSKNNSPKRKNQYNGNVKLGSRSEHETTANHINLTESQISKTTLETDKAGQSSKGRPFVGARTISGFSAELEMRWNATRWLRRRL